MTIMLQTQMARISALAENFTKIHVLVVVASILMESLAGRIRKPAGFQEGEEEFLGRTHEIPLSGSSTTRPADPSSRQAPLPESTNFSKQRWGVVRADMSEVVDSRAPWLACQRTLGRGYENEERVLRGVRDFIVQIGTGDLEQTAFDLCCQQLAPHSANTRYSRQLIVHKFCLYRHRTDSSCFVPDPLYFARTQPYRAADPRRTRVFVRHPVFP